MTQTGVSQVTGISKMTGVSQPGVGEGVQGSDTGVCKGGGRGGEGRDGGEHMDGGGLLLGGQTTGGSVIEGGGECGLGGCYILSVGKVAVSDLGSLGSCQASGSSGVEGSLELRLGSGYLGGVLDGDGGGGGQNSGENLQKGKLKTRENILNIHKLMIVYIKFRKIIIET